MNLYFPIFSCEAVSVGVLLWLVCCVDDKYGMANCLYLMAHNSCSCCPTSTDQKYPHSTDTLISRALIRPLNGKISIEHNLFTWYSKTFESWNKHGNLWVSLVYLLQSSSVVFNWNRKFSLASTSILLIVLKIFLYLKEGMFCFSTGSII